MFGWLFRRNPAYRVISDAGLVRADNQDSYFADRSRRLFCVADGMGGIGGGALASAILCGEVSKAKVAGLTLEAAAGVVDAAISSANAKIVECARRSGYNGMGTTAAVLLFDPRNPSRAAIGYAGDSRVYRRRGVKFKQLTHDHRKSSYSHILTRAVGMGGAFSTDWVQATVKKGDTWVVCTDGVHDMLPDATLNGILSRGGTPEEMVARIDAAVRRAGARDNYTVIVVTV